MKTQLHLSKARKIKPNFLVLITTSPYMHPSKEIIFLSASKIEYTAPVEINFSINQSFILFFILLFIIYIFLIMSKTQHSKQHLN